MSGIRTSLALILVALLMLMIGCRQVQQPLQTIPSTGPTEAKTDGTDPTEKAESNAPDFTMYDADGNVYHLSDFEGKPVVLNFWASWCGPCRREMPEFEEKYQELGANVTFLMVNLTTWNETVESANGLIRDQGYTFPVFFDLDGQAAAAYGIQSIPTTFFIDAEGEVIAYANGSIDGNTLQKGIDMISGQ
jgi:thiol-disulfide isomerase/thioredoxin